MITKEITKSIEIIIKLKLTKENVQQAQEQQKVVFLLKMVPPTLCLPKKGML
jgi:hypothetical protein